jgi:hypothetical protein
MVPIAATWTGPLPSAGGWHPALLSILLVVLAGIGFFYLRLGRAGGAVIRSPIHLCGVKDIASGQAHMGAGNLYAAPDAAIRGLLHAKHDTGYSDDGDAIHPVHTA